MIVNCTLRIYKMLIEKRQIMVDYVFCRLREDTYVPHCWKCLALSHQIRDCKIRDRVCRRCGVEEHHMNAVVQCVAVFVRLRGFSVITLLYLLCVRFMRKRLRE